MDRVTAGLLTLSLILFLAGLAGWGWRNRLRRQADVAPLPAVPADLPEPAVVIAGQYVVSTTAGDWLDRLAVHGLGAKGNARACVFADAVLLERTGAPDIYISAGTVTGVRLERGMAGKFVEKDGLVVITWQLGTTAVDTGFRTRHAADKQTLLNALTGILPPENKTAAHNTAEHNTPSDKEHQ